jgi:diguanylate cyclase (GGDEF)-like protein
MSVTRDSSVLRRRRTVEAYSLLSRGFGLTATVLFVAGLLDGPWGEPPAGPVRDACLVGIALMTLATALAVTNRRRPGGRHYTAFSAVQVVCDTVAIAGIVTAVQVFQAQTTWPLLTVPVVIAALRLRLLGALAAWSVTTGWLAAAVALFHERALPPGDLTMAAGVNLMIALLSGTQASAFGRQVRELEEVRRQLHHRATHDGLTGLANRGRLAGYAAGLDGRALAVLLLDLDGFKHVNDTLGHAAGDDLLREVAGRLTAALRDGDLAGRLGGDEFVVLLPDADAATAGALADRLRAAVGRPVVLAAGPASVGVSIGVACRPAGVRLDLDALLVRADAAMYREKAVRNRAAPVAPR